uniref:Uncharacterized protein n=1 Tax=Pseudomonas aeruginosa TaxID=287 RepID=A0A6C0L1G6_PSEAI|nr:hypothetical protein [Pseudomonas aeruginosa]UVN18903.1 Hypothetical protein [Pseudomonas aeruginosa]
MGKHFTCYETCCRGIDQEGNERDYWSFHSYHANTLIGLTVGRACIAFASWQFQRRQKLLRQQPQTKE